MTNLMQNKDSSWKVPSSSRPSQVAVIRREFVDLTGEHFSAVILNQLLYWTQRVKDFDLLLEEERSFHPECNVSPRHGWIYKTAPELVEETMLTISAPTMRKYLKLLIDRGWMDERPNPCDKWNKTTQYRVNLKKLQEDLQAIGYTLFEVYRGFDSAFLEEEITPNRLSNTLPVGEKEENVSFSSSNKNSLSSGFSSSLSEQTSKRRHLSSEESLSHPSLSSNEKILHSKIKGFASKQKIFASDERNFASYTYTENKTENKNKEHTQDACAREGFAEFFNKILGTWKKHMGQEVHLSEERQSKLTSLLSSYFGNDLSQWEQFCEQMSKSPFLMGGGPRRWKVSLDWILSEDNVLKVLEGNFDDPDRFELKKSAASKENRNEERSGVLASIADPIWQYWCTQLSFLDQREGPLSLHELKEISSARFAEFDGRLIWIESEDPKVLNRIDDLRLKILTVAQKTYPKARNIRTQLSTLKAGEDFLDSKVCPFSEHPLVLETKLNKKQPIGEEFYAQ